MADLAPWPIGNVLTSAELGAPNGIAELDNTSRLAAGEVPIDVLLTGGASGQVPTSDGRGGYTWQTPVAAIAATPEQYGAAGNGITDDTTALLAWIASGKTLALTPGKTYLARRVLSATIAGQSIAGNGATITRPAQTANTAALANDGHGNSATAGQSTITLSVANPGFRVNDQIVVSDGTGSAGQFTNTHTIGSIVGSTITIDDTWDCTVPLGGQVLLAGGQIFVGADNVSVRDVVLDGNLANATLTNWPVGYGLQIGKHGGASSVGVQVDHCRVVNQIGDAIVTNDAIAATIFGCDVENVAGRGISMGGTRNDNDCKILGNRIFNTETNPNAYLSANQTGTPNANDGHGAINLSLGGNNAQIIANTLDTGIAGIGGVNNIVNGGLRIIGNTIRNMSTYLVQASAITNDSPSDVLFQGNMCTGTLGNPMQLFVNQQGGSSNFPSNWQIVDNRFTECYITLNEVQQITVAGNRFISAGSTLNFIAPGAGCSDLDVHGNYFNGGANAFQITAAADGVLVKGNTIRGTALGGIKATAAQTDFLVEGNTIIATVASSNTNWAGIAMWGGEARGNRINLTAGGKHGITFNAASTTGLAEGNKVTTSGNPGTPDTINAFAGSAGIVIRQNILDKAPIDGSGTAVKVGNQINGGQLSGFITLNGTTAVVVATTEAANDKGGPPSAPSILFTPVNGTPVGAPYVSSLTVGTSFSVKSTSAADIAVIVYWEIRH